MTKHSRGDELEEGAGVAGGRRRVVGQPAGELGGVGARLRAVGGAADAVADEGEDEVQGAGRAAEPGDGASAHGSLLGPWIAAR
jgi:hypothetical protein